MPSHLHREVVPHHICNFFGGSEAVAPKWDAKVAELEHEVRVDLAELTSTLKSSPPTRSASSRNG